MRIKLIVVILTMLLVGTVLAATIDTTNHTVTTSNLYVDWSETNPEAIVDIRWNGSGNLTNGASVGCTNDLEFFGNSWVSEGEGTPGFVFQSLVGWGTTGAWNNSGSSRVSVSSQSSGCPGSADIPVSTSYQFFDHGARANSIQVSRQFAFGGTPYPYDFRPYIPRLSPMDGYTQVLHPDAGGGTLVTEITAGCDFGCRVDNWNDSWFAIHNPTTGQGLIYHRRPSRYDAALWVDQDSASFTNASSVLLLNPGSGFTGNATENASLCFYDSSTWTPSLSLPAGC